MQAVSPVRLLTHDQRYRNLIPRTRFTVLKTLRAFFVLAEGERPKELAIRMGGEVA